MSEPSRIALAYSGGLDTSVMIPWLRENYGADVVAVVADVGQQDDFEAVRRKALNTGAAECRVLDLKAAFAEQYIFPALRARAAYESRYLLGTALARPLIASAQVEVARETGCDALAHGCTGKGNDQVRFELAYQALAPDMTVVAPWREWELQSREDAIAYAEERGIPVAASTDRPYSIDQNLWHTSFEGGILEDPGAKAPDDVYDMTVDPARAPDEAEEVEIGFEAGFPVSLYGERLPPADLINALNGIAGRHGVGRVDLVENRVVGMKSRGVYETPAGTALSTALTDLESLTLDHATTDFLETVSSRYGELVYRGKWFTPLRASLDGFLESSHRHVTGTVTLRFYRGSCLPVARTSPDSLYREDLATFGEDAVYDQSDAGGFIRLWGLSSRVYAGVHEGRWREDGTEASEEAGDLDDGAPGPRERSPDGSGTSAVVS